MVEVQAILYAAADTVDLWAVPVVALLVGIVIVALLFAYELLKPE